MNALIEAFLRGEPRIFAAVLVIISILGYVAASNLAWHYSTSPNSNISRRVNALAASSYARLSYELLRLAYYMGIPYFALLLGWIDIRAMGLGFVDWANGVRWAVVLVLAAWSALTFVWVPFLRATANIPVTLSRELVSWSRRVMEIIYMQTHWAFYRAACIMLLTGNFRSEAAVYWGASAGLALTFIEAWADPRVRRHLSLVGEGELILWNAAQAIINVVGFVLTRNVWLLAAIHLALEFTVPHLRAFPKSVVPRPHPSRVNVVKTKS